MVINYHESEIFVPNQSDGGHYVENPHYIPGTKMTNLIQRMKHSIGSPGFGAFGAGLKRGGLSEKAWDLLKDICTFDYMGASEFEWGALPEAFSAIYESKDLEAYTIKVSGPPEFSKYNRKMLGYDNKELDKIKESHVLSTTVFVIAPKKIRPHVELIIYRIAEGDEGFLKERSNFRDTMFCAWYWTDAEEEDWIRQATQGWIELDNGYMFFASEDMWREFCRLFLPDEPSFDIQVTQPDFSSVDKALEGCKKFE